MNQLIIIDINDRYPYSGVRAPNSGHTVQTNIIVQYRLRLRAPFDLYHTEVWAQEGINSRCNRDKIFKISI